MCLDYFKLVIDHVISYSSLRNFISNSQFQGKKMNKLSMTAGRIAGFGGVLLCLVAVGTRLSGNYFLGGFQLATLLQAGVAAMVAGCFFLLAGRD
jgi:hypothetical protein